MRFTPFSPIPPLHLLTFITVLMAVDSLHWDFRFKTMARSLLGMLVLVRPGANLTLSGVWLEDGGTHKPGLVALRRLVGGPRNVVPMISCNLPDLGDGVWPPRNWVCPVGAARSCPPVRRLDAAVCDIRRSILVPRRGHGISLPAAAAR